MRRHRNDFFMTPHNCGERARERERMSEFLERRIAHRNNHMILMPSEKDDKGRHLLNDIIQPFVRGTY
jgi:hypothetical protein